MGTFKPVNSLPFQAQEVMRRLGIKEKVTVSISGILCWKYCDRWQIVSLVLHLHDLTPSTSWCQASHWQFWNFKNKWCSPQCLWLIGSKPWPLDVHLNNIFTMSSMVGTLRYLFMKVVRFICQHAIFLYPEMLGVKNFNVWLQPMLLERDIHPDMIITPQFNVSASDVYRFAPL